MSKTDRIEKEITLRAPRTKVWTALTDSAQFGTWFRAEFAGPFTVGERVQGTITYPGHEGTEFEVLVERIEPESRFSFRWHPGEATPGPEEPMTLVEFLLEDATDGVRLRVIESGFDALPPGRREEAFRLNDGGWTTQMTHVRHHVEA